MSADTDAQNGFTQEDRELFADLHDHAVEEGDRDVQLICERLLQSSEFNEETKS